MDNKRDRQDFKLPPGFPVSAGQRGFAMPSTAIDMQPWLTLTGATTVDVIMPAHRWLDGSMVDAYRMDVRITDLGSTVALLLESSPVQEGPWTTVASYTGATATTLLVSSEGGSAKFSRFLRWRLDTSSAGAWNICFMLRATPERGAPAAPRTPRKP